MVVAARTGGSGSTAVYWQTQLPIDYLDTSLVVDTWETVSANLSGGRPARVWYIVLEQTNNGATAETVELEVTINGTAYTFTFANIDSGADYFGYISFNQATGDFDPQITDLPCSTGNSAALNGYDDRTVPFTCANVGLIRVRQTSAVDVTSAQIEVNIRWDKLVGL